MWAQHVFNSDGPALLQLQSACALAPTGQPLGPLNLSLGAGLHAITGDEGCGKTTLLRLLCGQWPLLSGQRLGTTDGLWLDLALPAHDDQSPRAWWAQMQQRHPGWNAGWQQALVPALGLTDHLDKTLSMLSSGSRRKVGWLALLCAGARVTGIDQPWAAIDLASVRVLREVLQEAAEDPTRVWLVADYEADDALPWRSQIGHS